jgi:hypothetical protein
MAQDLIHFRPFQDSWNVRCLNGSAHASRTHDIRLVTCPICKDKEANKDFWQEHEAKHGNQWKISNQ